MLNKEEDYLGYVKYDGKLVADGYFDAKKSAEALIGIDEVFRYFIYQIAPSTKDLDFEFPVRIRKGTWETLIPHTIGEWLLTAVGGGLTTYLTTAAGKLAKNDIGDKTTKDIIKEAFKAIKWVIKICKHLNSFYTPDMGGYKFEERNGETYIGVPDTDGILLFVPKKYLELYDKCPEKLFSKISKYIIDGRELEIGLNPMEPLDADDSERAVRISRSSKFIFTDEDEDGLILFPELANGQYIELPGHVSRGNESENTIGFQYNGHTLTCFPNSGNITDHKELMFTNCIILGYIERRNKNGQFDENVKRPKIRYISLKPKPEERQNNLFD